jgi:spore coat polysaccharide biosynthesis protein SpsF
MNKAIFITARLGSSRLPNKHLLKIKDKYCIEYIIERVKRSVKAQTIVLCTTILNEDLELCNIAQNYGIEIYQGSVLDKLDRWHGAAKYFNIDFFVTADADDLFCEPELIDLAFSQYENNQADFIEWDQSELVCGAFTYGIKVEALERVCNIKKTDDTEMMWVYFTKNLFHIENLKEIPEIFKRPEIRATLDYIEDYMFFKNIIEHFGNNNFSLRDVIIYLDKNPDVIKINQFRNIDWANNQLKKIKESGDVQ